MAAKPAGHVRTISDSAGESSREMEHIHSAHATAQEKYYYHCLAHMQDVLSGPRALISLNPVPLSWHLPFIWHVQSGSK